LRYDLAAFAESGVMAEFSIALSADISPARLDALTRDFARDLGRSGMSARPAEGKPEPGERGLLTEIGKLVIDHVSGGLVGGAMDVVKAYLVREKSLRLVVTRPDGTHIEIDARNVGSDAVAAFLGAARHVAG
jgi:hypothetical protein